MTPPEPASAEALEIAPAAGGALPVLVPRPEPAPERHLHLVSPAEVARLARRRRLRLAAVLGGVFLTAVLFGVVFVQVLLSQGQLQLDHLQNRLTTEQNRNQRLRLEVAELASPARVVAAAQQRLGMVSPPGVTYLSPNGATNGPPKSAPVATAPAPPATPAPASVPAPTTSTTVKR